MAAGYVERVFGLALIAFKVINGFNDALPLGLNWSA